MALILHDICKSYNAQPVLNRFSHRFEDGSTTLITGPSGCGKTTLLRIAAGLIQPDSGTVTGRPSGAIPMVFQEDRLLEHLSPRANLRAVLPRGTDNGSLLEALRAVELPPDEKPVSELSGGMRRRVALLRALLMPGPLILLDEPFTGLDPDTLARVLDYTRSHIAGRTALLVSHDPQILSGLWEHRLELTPPSEDTVSVV